MRGTSDGGTSRGAWPSLIPPLSGATTDRRRPRSLPTPPRQGPRRARLEHSVGCWPATDAHWPSHATAPKQVQSVPLPAGVADQRCGRESPRPGVRRRCGSALRGTCSGTLRGGLLRVGDDVECFVGGVDIDGEPAEETLLAKKLKAERPWLAERHGCLPTNSASWSVAVTVRALAVVPPIPIVCSAAPVIRHQPGQRPRCRTIVERAGVDQAQARNGVLRPEDGDLEDWARHVGRQAGKMLETESHSVTPPGSTLGSSGTRNTTAPGTLSARSRATTSAGVSATATIRPSRRPT